jgi:hypothetical protein
MEGRAEEIQILATQDVQYLLATALSYNHLDALMTALNNGARVLSSR